MFGIGLPELLVIFALALIVLGPEKLPEVAKQVAAFINQLRQAADEFKKELDLDEIPGIRTDELLKTDAFREHEAKVQALEKMAKTLYGDEKRVPGGMGPEWKEAQGARAHGASPQPEAAEEGDGEASGGGQEGAPAADEVQGGGGGAAQDHEAAGSPPSP